MKKISCLPATKKISRIFAGVFILLFSWGTMAADHLDSPETKAEPAADITDIYTWMSPDAKKLNLVMDVNPMASMNSKFSNAVQYVFHVNSSAKPGVQQTETLVICTFDVNQMMSCSVGANQMISAQNASDPKGVMSADGKFRAFAGLRDDPFFFDLTAFTKTVDVVKAAAGSLQFNQAGCPTVPANVQTALGKSLAGGKNTFAGQNVLSLVIQADKEMFGPGPVYGIWGSTHRIQ